MGFKDVHAEAMLNKGLSDTMRPGVKLLDHPGLYRPFPFQPDDKLCQFFVPFKL